MIDHILNALDEEIAKLPEARAILAERAMPAGKTTPAPVVPGHDKPRRTMSVQARRAIAEAQRKRWAKLRSQKKAAAPASS